VKCFKGASSMNKKTMLFSLVLSLLFHPLAFAQLESSSVSASTILQTQISWDGKQIEYPSGTPEITGMVIEIAVGGETGWHKHSAPSFAMIVQGELEVHLRDGRVNRLKAGDMLAEVVDTWHNGHNVGDVPVKLAVFGQVLTEADEPH